ncbi:MAG: ABC transporter permease subunit [Rhodospirillales bacterium]|nr:ABC transporter permease subunit [Rhodospirillales bacterium]
MGRLAWIRLGVIAGFIGLLEILCRGGAIGRLTMIPPSEMAAALVELIASGAVDDDIGRTLGSVAAAFTLAVVFGFVGGVALHAIPRLRRAADPLLATYYAVPFFVMIIATLNGLDRIPRVLDKVARTHRMRPLETALRLKLPAAAPYLFTGVKLAIAYSFIGVIASEFILAASGLGYQIAYAYNNFDNRTMYALMLFVLTLVTTINMALYVWERRLQRRRLGR